MQTAKNLKLAMRTSAAFLALTLSSTTIVGTVALSVGPAFAQGAATTDLTADQVAAVQSQLATAIQNAGGPSGDSTALANAIALVESNAVALYGASAAGSVTTAVLSAPALTNVAASTIGTGLGEAAATIAANLSLGTAAATAVANAVANEGPSGSQVAFSNSVTANGGPGSVATAGTAPPSTTTATGGSTTTASGSGASSSNSGGGTLCANPSCT